MTSDCGNSPKNNFVKNFTVAIAKRDNNFIENSISEEIILDFVGGNEFIGKVEVLKALSDIHVQELIIDTILSHGKGAACNGEIVKEKGSKIAFSIFFKFANAKGEMMKTITIYSIKI